MKYMRSYKKQNLCFPGLCSGKYELILELRTLFRILFAHYDANCGDDI